MNSGRAAVFFRKELLAHDFGSRHLYRVKERLDAYFTLLREKGIINKSAPVLESKHSLNEDEILAVHDASLLENIKTLSTTGGWLDGDTPVPIGTYERIKIQLGTAIKAATLVMEGKHDRAVLIGAFGGHHATSAHTGKSFGFCYFNTSAVWVKKLLRQNLAKRVLILDLDAHHGNGIQEIFYEDPSVLYISLHMDPRYSFPGTGFVDEVGSGAGIGYNINVPLPQKTTTQTYLKAIDEIFTPAMKNYKPDLVHLLFGSDTHHHDPLSQLSITMDCYPAAAQRVRESADKICGGRVITQLAGGYDIPVAARAFYLVTGVMLDAPTLDITEPHGEIEDRTEADVTARGDAVITAVKQKHTSLMT